MKDQGEETRNGARREHLCISHPGSYKWLCFCRTGGGQMGGDLYILQLTRIMEYFQNCLLEAPGFSPDFFPLIMRDSCGGTWCKDLNPSQRHPVRKRAMRTLVLSSQMVLWLCLPLSEGMNCTQNREWERINYTQLNRNIIKNNPLHFFLITVLFYSLEALWYFKAIMSLK